MKMRLFDTNVQVFSVKTAILMFCIHIESIILNCMHALIQNIDSEVRIICPCELAAKLQSLPAGFCTVHSARWFFLPSCLAFLQELNDPQKLNKKRKPRGLLFPVSMAPGRKQQGKV